MHRKSQVTIFLIIGILVLLSLGLVFYLNQLALETTLKPKIYQGASLDKQFDSLKNYIGFCIQLQTPIAIEKLAMHGGSFDTINSLDYNGDKINIFCEEQDSLGCVQKPLTKQALEAQLQDYLTLLLHSCIDLKNNFENKGYSIFYNPSALKVKSSINSNDVFFTVSYPITLTNNDTVFTTGQFTHKETSPLGQLYLLAVDIANNEIRQGFFDKDTNMQAYPSITIEKTRPYPDIVYALLKDGLAFRFGIKGKDTAGNLHYLPGEPAFGCCTADDVCFANTPNSSCPGVYVQDVQDCSCSQNFRQEKLGCCVSNGQCDFTAQQDCGNESVFYEDCSKADCPNMDCGTKKHGTSWCEYDSIAGYGYDYVGSRHYLKSCFNRKIITEPCRDFREELCTEEGDKAVCRPNRWPDCQSCATKECCENTEFRDCRWKNFFLTESKCVPDVPPGLKFWEDSAAAVCSRADQHTKALGAQSNSAWIDTTAILCYSYGDCGNYRNIVDKITKEGFINFDGREHEYVYGEPGKTSNTEQYAVKLPLNTRKQQQLAGRQTQARPDSFAQQLAYSLLYLDAMQNNVPWPSFSRCNPWAAPKTDDCRLCGEKGFCSEYRCRSLGEHCIFTDALGIPVCSQPETVDRKPPVIRFDTEMLSSPYNATAAKLAARWFTGYELTPPIKPYTPITFGITADEEVRCRASYLPSLKFEALTPYWFSDSTYASSHNITLRLPFQILLPDGIYKALNITSDSQLLKLPGFAPSAELDLVALKVLDDFKQGIFNLFVLCNDRSGNMNDDGFFISLKIANDTDDDPPLVAAVYPGNNAKIANATVAAFYLNEPSECRYGHEDVDYGAMPYAMGCGTSLYDMKDIGGGTYSCTADMGPAAYYIRCKDNPPLIETAAFTVALSDTLAVFPAHDIINNTILLTSLQDIQASIGGYLDVALPAADCRYDFTDKQFEDMNYTADCSNGNQCLLRLDKDETYYVACLQSSQKKQNVNNASYHYVLQQASPLSITALKPDAEVNTISPILEAFIEGDLNETACSFSFGPDASAEKYGMQKADSHFTAKIGPLQANEEYSITVYCTDTYGNKAQQTMEVRVIV